MWKKEGDVVDFLLTPKSEEIVIYELNTINLEHGQVYNIGKNFFNYYEGYIKGKNLLKIQLK